MQTGSSTGHTPHESAPPHPSSSAPHCMPAPSHVAGTHVVVVVLDDVVVVVLDGAAVVVAPATVVGVVLVEGAPVEVVGVKTGVDPHSGGVGATLDWHVFM